MKRKKESKKKKKDGGKKNTDAGFQERKKYNIKHNLNLILFLVVLSFLFRFIYYLEINDTPYFLPTGEGLDQNTYIEWAKEIKSGEFIGNSAFDFAPLYPYVLAGIFFISNNDLNFSILVQLLICSLGSIMIFLIGNKIFGKWAGFFAGVVYSVYGVLIFFTLQFLGESFAVLLLLISLYFLIIGEEKQNKREFLLSGLFLGLACLGRPNFLLIPVFIFCWGIYNVIKKRDMYKKLVIFYFIGLIFVLAPVILRNYILERDFILITSHGGINFYLGNNRNATGTLSMPDDIPPTQKGAVEYSKIIAENETEKSLKPSEVSFYWMNKGFKYIFSNPFGYFKLQLKKIFLFFGSYEIPLDSNFEIYEDRFYTLKFTLGFWLIAPLAVFGFYTAKKRKMKDILILLYFLGVFVSVIMFYVSSRYRIPAIPLFILYTGFSIEYIITEIKKWDFKTCITNFFILLFLFLVVNINIKQRSKKMYDSISNYNLGNSFMNQGYIDGGIELYQKALSLNEKWLPARSSLAAVYNLKATQAMDSEEINAAIELLNKAIELDNAVPEYYFNIGNAFIKQKKYDRAVNALKNSVDISPEYTNGLTNLGVAYSLWGIEENNMEYLRNAVEYLNRSLKINDNQIQAKEILTYIKNKYLKN